ncbi:MAG: hypothetical protein RLZZ200_1654 [Pseudomonadota bacterium]
MTDGKIVDCFAGGGGASTGIERGARRFVNDAINHDPQAVAMHMANHPRTRHWTQDVHNVDPRAVAEGEPISLAWFSPDCTHFSRAKGGKPRQKHIRDLAWVVVRWAGLVHPDVIMLENVPEFRTWGPLDDDGFPIKERTGETFLQWRDELEALGYEIQFREMRACDYGAPTSRKRFFMVARCDGRPIVWPERSHGKGLLPYRTAAECIDFSIPCPSIFDRKKPLVEATQRRVANGIRRYVIEAAQPFVVSLTHQGGDARNFGVGETFPTITGAHRGELAYVTPTLVQTGYGERLGQRPRSLDLHKPLGTIVADGAKHALVAPTIVRMNHDGQGKPADSVEDPLATITTQHNKHLLTTAFLAKHFGGHETPGRSLSAPVDTVTSRDHHALITSHLVKLYGTANGAPVDEPMPTVTGGGQHIAEVRAFLMHYYSGGGQTRARRHLEDTPRARARVAGRGAVPDRRYRDADAHAARAVPRAGLPRQLRDRPTVRRQEAHEDRADPHVRQLGVPGRGGCAGGGERRARQPGPALGHRSSGRWDVTKIQWTDETWNPVVGCTRYGPGSKMNRSVSSVAPTMTAAGSKRVGCRRRP